MRSNFLKSINNNNLNIVIIKYRNQNEKISYFDCIKELESVINDNKYRNFNVNITLIDNLIGMESTCEDKDFNNIPINKKDTIIGDENINFIIIKNILPNGSKK